MELLSYPGPGASGIAPARQQRAHPAFLGSYWPIAYGSLPLVDAWGYALFAACLLQLLDRRFVRLYLLFSLALLVKETAFLVPVATWLAERPRRGTWIRMTGFLPATLAYVYFRFLLTFGVLSLFAAYGWWLIREHRDHPLVRWSPLVPLIVIVPFVLALNVGRVWAYAFPVVIPLSLVGIRSFVRLRP